MNKGGPGSTGLPLIASKEVISRLRKNGGEKKPDDSLQAMATPAVVENISGNYELRDTLRQTRKEVIPR
ncbi:MAG: hypothetical protein IPN26_11135 [Bacteroidetes bacterium]|nr:hypothetical protein [Bacteroidota bacterium]